MRVVGVAGGNEFNFSEETKREGGGTVGQTTLDTVPFEGGREGIRAGQHSLINVLLRHQGRKKKQSTYRYNDIQSPPLLDQERGMGNKGRREECRLGGAVGTSFSLTLILGGEKVGGEKGGEFPWSFLRVCLGEERGGGKGPGGIPALRDGTTSSFFI